MQKIQSCRQNLNETFIQTATRNANIFWESQSENAGKSTFLREIVQNDRERPEALCKTDIYRCENKLYIVFTSPGS